MKTLSHRRTGHSPSKGSLHHYNSSNQNDHYHNNHHNTVKSESDSDSTCSGGGVVSDDPPSSYVGDGELCDGGIDDHNTMLKYNYHYYDRSKGHHHHHHNCANDPVVLLWKRKFHRFRWLCSSILQERMRLFSGGRTTTMTTTTTTATGTGTATRRRRSIVKSPLCYMRLLMISVFCLFSFFVGRLNFVVDNNNHSPYRLWQLQQEQIPYKNRELFFPMTTTTTSNMELFMDGKSRMGQTNNNIIMKEAGYVSRPRMTLSYYEYDDIDQEEQPEEEQQQQQQQQQQQHFHHYHHQHHQQEQVQLLNNILVRRLDPNLNRWMRPRSIPISNKERRARERLEMAKSDDSDFKRAEPIVAEGCEPLYEWQKVFHPVCNMLHETDLSSMLLKSKHRHSVHHVADGGFRSVWKIHEGEEGGHSHSLALKTLKLQDNEFRPRHYDKHQRDAALNDQLGFSNYIAPIQGFCGMSGLYEYAPDGTLDNLLWKDGFWSGKPNHDRPLSNTEKLVISYQVVTAIADVHNTDREGLAGAAHTDIMPNQFVYSRREQIFKLNDFNRGRYIGWDKQLKQPCGFKIERNRGKFRSPEEYMYQIETEKIDVYSMGNVLYSIVTGQFPFFEERSSKAQSMVKHGHRPQISKEIRHSKDEIIQTILQCIDWCWEQDPYQRPTARDIQLFLIQQLQTHRILSHRDAKDEQRRYEKLKFVL